MQTDKIEKKEIPVLLKILCLLFALIAFVSSILFFIGDSWIPTAVMYGSVVVLALLAAFEKIKYHKEKFMGILFIIVAFTSFLTLIQTLVRNVNI